MSKHPIFLDLRGRPVVVIGGGAVAERKVEALLDSGADVTVVTFAMTDRIREWRDDGRVRVHERRYRNGDLAGACLAYVATGDGAVNDAVRAEADATGVWLNVADEPAQCDFFAPAVVRRGSLTVAISTDGASPALAARLRERLEQELGPECERALEDLRLLRERCRRDGTALSDPSIRAEIDRVIDRIEFLRKDRR